MDTAQICTAITDSFPYPIVFADVKHVIRYTNRAAQYHYCTERGHDDLLGKSLLDCHFNPASREMIEAIISKFKKDAKELFLKVNDRNQRVYITPVLDGKKNLIGYYERFEMNLSLQPIGQQGPAPNTSNQRR
jgi:DUF438 domain-containing protein